MATNKTFSMAAFVAYGNSQSTPAQNFQNAFVSDAKRFYLKAGCPSKDEIDILDTIKPDLTNTVEQIPQFVSGFMHDEKRAFDLPAPDDKTCAASISVVSKDKEINEGTIQFGAKKGEKYKSVTRAHDELSVKNRRDPFKEKK